MAQDGTTAGGASYTLDNVTFPVGRTKLQSIFDAIRSTNIGNTAPDLVAGQFWIDNNTPSTTVWTLYFYDGTDSIQFATIDTINNSVNFIDSTFDLINDTTPQLGGDLDLNSNDITGTGNINITGTATFSSTVTGQDFRHAGDSDTYFGFPADNQLQLVGGNSEILKAYQIAGAYGILQVNGSGSATYPNFTFNGDSNTGMYLATTDTLAFTTGGSERMRLGTSEAVINEGSADFDFRVESDNNTNALFVQGSDGHIGVGTGTLPRTLNIYGASNGTIGLDNPVSGSPQIAFKQNGTDKAYVTYWDAFDTLALSDGSGNGLHFKPSTGNVGIGTTSPDARFHTEASFSNSLIEEIGRFSRIGGTTAYGSARNGVIAFEDQSNPTLTGAIGGRRENPGGNYNSGLSFWIAGLTGSPITSVSGLTEGMRLNANNNLEVFGGAVFNENSGDYDFRVESDNNTHALFVDGGSDAVTIGKSAVDNTTAGHRFNLDGFVSHVRSGNGVMRLNRLSNDGNILEIYKDGGAVGSIGTYAGDIIIGTTDTGLRFDDGASAYIPWNTSTNSATDGTISLGFSTVKYNNLYLSGSVYLGGTGSANALDDYEEGDWTPSLGGTTTNPTTSYNHQVGRYTKIGRTVTIDFYIQLNTSGNSGGTGDLTINGFPFNVGSLNTHGKSGLCMYTAGFSTAGNGAPIGFYAVNNSTFAYFRSPASSYPSTSFHTGTQASDIGNSVIVAGTLTYQIT
jgi:hypothetical protein